MGCISSAQLANPRERPYVAGDKLNKSDQLDYGSLFYPCRPLHNPCNQELPKLMKGSSGASTSASKSDSIATIQDSLERQEVNPQEEEHNFNSQLSVILKRGKIRRSQSVGLDSEGSKERQDWMKAVGESQILEGECTQNQAYSTIVINSPDIEIEFLLPKARAGPLVIPFIDFSNYII